MTRLIPQEMIESIRNETNIVDVIGQYVQLKKSGKNYLGLCPFHNEKTPSFSVAEDKQLFHCFGCGKGGNVYSFIQEIEGLNFPEAVKKVAEFSQIDVSEYVTDEEMSASEEPTQNRKQLELHEEVAKFYHHILLNTKVGEHALSYLYERGLTLETIKEFKLGFAPMERTILNQVMTEKGYEEEVLNDSGLFYETETGERLNRFYQRVMFPIENHQGKIIGFSGRLLTDEKYDLTDQPKYLNSPETNFFNKRFILYHFHDARPTIRKTNDVILFEGFMDVISAAQSGVQNGVASMGTSLTTDQIKMLERVTENISICYDGDNAGVEATMRAIDLISKHSQLSCQVISIPNKLDPDDYRKIHGEDQLRHLLENNRDTIFQFKKEYFKRNRNLEQESDKIEYIDDMLASLVEVPSIIETDMYLTQLADDFLVSKDALQNELSEKRQEIKQANRQTVKRQAKELVVPTQHDRRVIHQVEKAERLIIYRLLTEKSYYNRLNQVDDFSFYHDAYQELYTHIVSCLTEYGSVTISEMFDYLKEAQLKSILTEISFSSFSEESSDQELVDCLRVIDSERLKKQIKLKLQEQSEAKRIGDQVKELEAMMEIINLQKELQNIS